MISRNKAAVLIATYNKAVVFDRCLLALSVIKRRDLFDFFVVDNNSTDQNKKILENYSNVKYLHESKNYYASKALNDGFNKFNLSDKYKYIFIMAHDVLVDKNTLYELLQMMKSHPSLGMLGATHFEFGTSIIRTTGHSINRSTSLLHNFISYKRKARLNHFSSLFVTTTELYKKIGGFNDILFPMIYEEPDFGERILDEGYQIKCCAGAKIWHPIEIKKSDKTEKIQTRIERIYSTKAKSYLFFRNRILYMSLHAGFLRFLIFYFIFYPIIFLYYFTKVDHKLKKYAVKGFIDGSVFGFTKNQNYIKMRNKKILNI